MARWWWLGPWLRCPYVCLPRHISTGCLHARQRPLFPEHIVHWALCFTTLPLWLCLNVMSRSRNYTTAIVQHSLSKTAVFTWQQCLLAEVQNIVAHKIFIRASCLIVVWSICCANCGAELSFPWKNTVSCELLVRFNSNKMDMRGNGFQLRQRGVWPDSQEENISAKCQAFFFFLIYDKSQLKDVPSKKRGHKSCLLVRLRGGGVTVGWSRLS